MSVFLLPVLLVPLLALPAFAAEPAPPRYNAVTLQGSAQREVANDLLNATLFVEVNDASPAGVANAVNKTLNEALRIAREQKQIETRSGNYQTFPVYTRNNQLQNWRGRGEIRIESRDFQAASVLIGKLQGMGMQLGGMQFSVSTQARRAAENELIVEAIAAFKARTEIAKNALGGRGYKLQHLNLSSGHGGPPRPLYAARAAAQEVSPPQLESGFSTITVDANGTVELLE